ncbi:MAG: CinA family protein [Spirochaetes bacterium]|nr:CinA family protein [Spirochaetota bacterium]
MSRSRSLLNNIACTLREKRLTLAFAESCTGGWLAKAITDRAGASDYFKGSLVSYSNESKIRILGVRASTLRQYGAVSRQTAGEMAGKAARLFRSDISLAVTGIAGPAGGRAKKPVGTVFIAVYFKKRTKVFHFIFQGSRKKVRQRTVAACLRLLNKILN